MPNTPNLQEKDVLSLLLAQSVSFQRFYEVERQKIDREVYWDTNSSFHCSFSEKDGIKQCTVHVTSAPANVSDAFKVAHELMHIVLVSEKFPAVKHREQANEYLALRLGDLLTSPLMSSRLNVYGIDVKADVEERINNFLPDLINIRSIPLKEDAIALIIWTTTIELEYEIVTSQGQHSGYYVLLNRLLPDIAKKVDELMKLIKEVGYDTPKKQENLLRTICRKFDLNQHIIIIGNRF